MWPTTVTLGLVIGFAQAELKEEDNVLVLDEKNFDETVKANPIILVEFYAPWCGHCKQLAPEYAGAAKQLKNAKPPIPLAKVDATSEGKLSERYGVRGYPTLKLFVDGRDQEYTGGRTEQSIVTWVLRKAGPPALNLEDVPAAEQFEKDNKIAVLGFFDQKGSRDTFEAAARQLEDVMFGYSTSPQVAQKYGVTPPAVKMLFPHDEKTAVFQGDIQNTAELETFIKNHRHPLVVDFKGEVAPELFGDGRPILFLFRQKEEDKSQAAEKEIREVAKTLQRKVLLSVAGASEPMDQRLMDYVGVDHEEFPTLRLIVNPMAGMIKYKLEGDITAASVTKFMEDFNAGTLQAHLKSEAVPASQPGPVQILVGSTFKQAVMDTSKDVLVEFYAPWCGHCKKLEPIYRDLAKKLEGVSTLMIAKMDATANDADGVDVQGFPTIKFWRANKKDDPLDYDGDRDMDSFVSWLEEKASLSFNRDDLKTEL